MTRNVTMVRIALKFAFRNKVRFILTVISVGSALLAFLFLESVVSSWYDLNASSAKQDRVMIRHALTITSPLYTYQAEKIRAVPGVREVSWMCWFAGFYKEEKEKFTQIAADLPSYFRLYPEFRPDAAQMDELLADATGALVGKELASQYGWKLGDRITITGTIYPGEWPLTIRAIYDGPIELDRTRLYFHWKYLNDKLPGGDHVQRILAKVDSTDVGRDIDELFVNSNSPTKTESEAEIEAFWSSWSTAIIGGIRLASLLVLAILGLVLGNSMAMATREATHEYAAMRAIGFRSSRIMGLIAIEGSLVAAAGIALGLLWAPGLFQFIGAELEEQLGGTWDLDLGVASLVRAVIVTCITCALAASWPAWRTSNRPLVALLRQGSEQ